MKIRFITPWYGEFAGGAEFAARKLSENLLKEGVDVGVLTTCCRAPYDDWWTDFFTPGNYKVNGVPVSRFQLNKESAELYHQANHKIINGFPISKEDELNFMRGSINSHSLISFIKMDRQSIYVFIPYLYGLTFWGINAIPESSIMIPCLHDEPVAKWGVVKETFLKAKKIIFLSEEERELAKRLYDIDSNSTPVAGVGIDADISCNASRFRDKYKIQGRFLVYVGRKDRGKNIHILIDYFKHYRGLFDKDLKMVFIGGGDNSLILNDNNKLIDLGYISEQDKYDAIAASIALCNMSENESFSFVIMESWLTCRPVIVSSKSSVTRKHCMKSNGGFFVSNAEEFCMRVKQLSDHENLAGKMGEAGRKYVLENYAWDIITSKYIDIFEKIK